MILKWLITGIIVYFIYKRFIQPKRSIGGRSSHAQIKNDPPPKQEGEYIDYEEVD